MEAKACTAYPPNNVPPLFLLPVWTVPQNRLKKVSVVRWRHLNGRHFPVLVFQESIRRDAVGGLVMDGLLPGDLVDSRLNDEFYISFYTHGEGAFKEALLLTCLVQPQMGAPLPRKYVILLDS